MNSVALTAVDVVLDASFAIGICAKEPGKFATAQTELQQRIQAGCLLHAPHLLIMECAYVLCGKHQTGVLAAAEYSAAMMNLLSFQSLLVFPTGGDAALLTRAEKIRSGYGCSRSADSFYLALADSLSAIVPAEILTFDDGQRRQAAQAGLPILVTVLTP